MIKRKKIKTDNEYLILSHMIMNKDILSCSFNRYKSKELKTKHFSEMYRYIFRWLIRYYAQYHNAPKKTISEIFKRKSKKLSPDVKEMISEYLIRLSDEYEKFQDKGIDPVFIQEEIIPDFIREKEILIKIDNAQNQLEAGEYEEAENIISSYQKINREETDKNLGTITPYSNEDILIGMGSKEANTELYRFDGDLNYLIGPLCKSWLVAVTGIEKSGKSYILQEIAYNAALFQKRKVLTINLELGANLVRNRMWRRLTHTSNEKEILISSVLDCDNNQKGCCQVREKQLNRKPLFRSNGEIVSFSKRTNWKICNRCINSYSRKKTRTRQFIPVPWFEQNVTEKISQKIIEEAVKKNRFRMLSNLRVKCFPRYSINFDESYDYILRYIDKTKWVPEIIIFDYLDILAPEGKLETRHDIDMKWKKASKLAGELNCLVITADQATKASRTQYALDQMSTSESKTKDSHLDIRIALNQTDDEKELDIARISVLFHRHAKFNIKSEILLTQRLATAEPIRDNSYLYGRGNKYSVIQ